LGVANFGETRYMRTSENRPGEIQSRLQDEAPRTIRREIRATAPRYHHAGAIGQQEAKERWIS
jgi:hypothetical protein